MYNLPYDFTKTMLAHPISTTCAVVLIKPIWFDDTIMFWVITWLYVEQLARVYSKSITNRQSRMWSNLTRHTIYSSCKLLKQIIASHILIYKYDIMCVFVGFKKVVGDTWNPFRRQHVSIHRKQNRISWADIWRRIGHFNHYDFWTIMFEIRWLYFPVSEITKMFVTSGMIFVFKCITIFQIRSQFVYITGMKIFFVSTTWMRRELRAYGCCISLGVSCSYLIISFVVCADRM